MEFLIFMNLFLMHFFRYRFTILISKNITILICLELLFFCNYISWLIKKWQSMYIDNYCLFSQISRISFFIETYYFTIDNFVLKILWFCIIIQYNITILIENKFLYYILHRNTIFIEYNCSSIISSIFTLLFYTISIFIFYKLSILVR